MSAPALDHLILLVPSLKAEDVAFLSAEFELRPGGKHGDGLTENTLIILPDGVYLEILSFQEGVTPERRDPHWWGRKQNGWIDFALLPTPQTAAERVAAANERAGATFFQEPIYGGRTTPDGKEVKWAVAFPSVDREKGEERGKIPFWCEDVTERSLRVPSKTTPHPTGATGVSSIELLAKPGRLAAYVSELALVLPRAPSGSAHQFVLETPVGGSVAVTVREAVEEEEIKFVEGSGEGLYAVEFTSASGEKRKVGEKEGARITI
ncbi:hypothetical protein MNV49_002183 [Pseudohyphozyma bogoriensis]|nr:hypothetical protein MNV49_002183 [Pseudohyphozyma bogoriensis]